MTSMNAAVDLDKKKPADVAKAFLEANNLGARRPLPGPARRAPAARPRPRGVARRAGGPRAVRRTRRERAGGRERGPRREPRACAARAPPPPTRARARCAAADGAAGVAGRLPGEAGVLLEAARDRHRAEHGRRRARPQARERVAGEVLGDHQPRAAGVVGGQERRQAGEVRRHQVREPGARQAAEGDEREPQAVERQRAAGGVEAAVVQRLAAREQRVLGGGVDLDGQHVVQRGERVMPARRPRAAGSAARTGPAAARAARRPR